VNTTGTLKVIFLAGISITAGAVIASLLILNEMNRRYNENTYGSLENISRIMSATIDTKILASITSPAQYNSPEYMSLNSSLRNTFSRLKFDGERIYQMILAERDGMLYSLYDLENSAGSFYPFEEYGEGPYKEAYDTKDYVHVQGVVTSEGSWLFVCGPLFDDDGNVIALLETGYNMRTVEEETRKLIIQTSLIVLAAAIAILLVMIEFILILDAYRKNKNEIEKKPIKTLSLSPTHFQAIIVLLIETYKKFRNKKEEVTSPSFYPELLRAGVFFLFVTGNLATALLPMYAANLYQPLFNLPREFVVTLPFMTDVIFAALALLIIPFVLEKIGLKLIGVVAGVFIIIGNVLCFIATNTLYLAIAYAFTGFFGGALLLVFNTIIGGQKDVKNVNSGFAHFNASYLAGVNVGVVFGSILAQFFAYRIVFLFSTLSALVLFLVILYSVRSKLVNHIYEITIFKDRRKPAPLIKFIFTPRALGTLLLVLLPYSVSTNFTNYFMPIFGMENGLLESNIGQLILLSGLFAILFGTSLCEYVGEKFPIRVIIIVSLLMNAGAVYLFSLSISVPVLIAAIVIMAIVNIFALTNIQTYYTTLYRDTRVSSMRAMSVYSAVENISLAIGPVVFSYILSYNIASGMKIFAAASLGCAVLFILISSVGKNKKTGAE
jgi:predicted MFS family arabinose efflux permease